jgi:hypothetical protein
VSVPPEPHPLDYDWRFTHDTVQLLAKLAPQQGETLILGAPSVARFLEASGRQVILVDRQPLQGVTKHLARDAATFALSPSVFAGAIVDPPWYPNRWRLWTAWVARSVGIDRDIFVSIWPADTRPSAASEIDSINQWLLNWSEIESLPFPVRYDTPIFERAAISASEDKNLAISPGVGSLLRVRVKRLPPAEGPIEQDPTWLRFIINDYQLALRREPTFGKIPSIHRLRKAHDWTWPFVSERAPERQLISLWSSRNEVAGVSSSSALVASIRTAIKSTTVEQFEKALIKFPSLLDWQIPRPPYRRVLEWSHPQ